MDQIFRSWRTNTYHARLADQDFDDFLIRLIREKIIKKSYEGILVLCLENTRSTGDCLGPMVGSLLSDEEDTSHQTISIAVLGDMRNPVYEIAVKDEIEKTYPNYLKIVVTAAIGKKDDVSLVSISDCPSDPGTVAGKELSSIGDIVIRAFVSSPKEELSNVDLVFAWDIARYVASNVNRIRYMFNKRYGQVS